MIVAITALAAGQDESYLSWAVFAALIISGIATALQAAKIGRLGGGHVLIMGATPNFIAVSVLAIEEDGPAMLASLIVLSSLFYLALAAWLPLLRRIITPVVSGTVLMLIAAMILPIAFDRLQEVPEGSPLAAGPCVAGMTLVAATMLMLRGPRTWRPWSLLLGIAAGCVAAVPFGLYDFGRLSTASWVGIPASGFPGLDLTPSAGFWALLPMFLIVTLVQVIKGIGDGVVIQQVSRRRPQTTDFRLIQGSTLRQRGRRSIIGHYRDAAHDLLFVFYRLAHQPHRSLRAQCRIRRGKSPRGAGVLSQDNQRTNLHSQPGHGGFLLVAIGMLFVEGVQTLVRAGLDPQKAIVVGLAFSIGLGMQHHNVLADLLPSPWGALLGNGITAGTATAIALTAFLELTSPRSQRLEVRLDIADLPASTPSSKRSPPRWVGTLL